VEEPFLIRNFIVFRHLCRLKSSEQGFVIAGFYEDKGEELLDQVTEPFIATQAMKI